MLHITDVVERQAVDAVKPPQFARESKVTLGFEQPLHQLRDRSEQHRVALAHQLAPDRRHHVGLARARIAENTVDPVGN